MLRGRRVTVAMAAKDERKPDDQPESEAHDEYQPESRGAGKGAQFLFDDSADWIRKQRRWESEQPASPGTLRSRGGDVGRLGGLEIEAQVGFELPAAEEKGGNCPGDQNDPGQNGGS